MPFIIPHFIKFHYTKKSKGTKVLFERTDAFFHFSAYFTVFLNFGSIIYGTDESELILQPHFHFRY
ncbi:hypothetical protein CRN08_14070 [Enterococcus faecium]|nr:hypothetical protein CRN08_14070 [Enterococcus faecium]